MAMNSDPSPRVIPDIPLPGHYQVLTAQMNLTLYPPSGVCKWVITTRDPSPGRQLELTRTVGQAPWLTIVDRLTPEVVSAIEGMTYLAGMPERRGI